MKVLQINTLYKEGSTGKIVYDINSYLIAHNINTFVCYGRNDRTKDLNVKKICSELESRFNNLLSRFTGIKYGGIYFSNNKIKKIIKKENPDIIHIHCLNGFFINIYSFIQYLKKLNCKIIITLHAEFMYTANCGYSLECNKYLNGCGNCPRLKQETKSLFFDKTHKSWIRMNEAFKGMNNVIFTSVSPWLKNRAKNAPILSGFRHEVVLNGLDTKIFNYKNNHIVSNQKIIFHATPAFINDENHIKGGYYILKLAEKLKEENIKFVVAGEYDKSIKIPNNVVMIGKVVDQTKLAELYSKADLTVLTSKKETFSMIVAESLCCGTPIVGFKAGAPEMITINDYSEFVDYGDVDKLSNTILSFLSRDWNKNTISNIAITKYSKEQMAQNYLDLYESVLNNNI